MVGYPTETGMKVIYAEEIKHTAQTPGRQRLFNLLKTFNIQYFVMDSGPDITLVRDALEFCKMNGIRAFASVREDSRGWRTSSRTLKLRSLK